MRASAQVITLNGSHGEGGGALVRTALAVAALTQQAVRIHHIRGGTRKPGLTSEDLTYLQMLEAVVGADVSGDKLDSDEVTFTPKHAPRPLRGIYDIRAHEKGSVPGNALMVTSSLLPVLARTGAYSAFDLKGETYNPNTLTFDAFTAASLRLHARQGLVATAEQTYAGFGYAALGEVHVEVEPSSLHGFEWLGKGGVIHVRGVLAYADLHRDIVDRGLKTAEGLAQAAGYTLELQALETNSRTPGVHMTFIAEYERGLGSGQAMGTRGLRMERVIDQAWEQLEQFMRSPGTLDSYLADQALVTAAFANSPTTFLTERITPRLQTMAWVIKQFMPIEITILGRPGESGKVSVKPRGSESD